MKKRKNIIRFFLLLLLPVILMVTSCGIRNMLAADSAEYQQTLEKVNSLDFEIENDWANPLRDSRINLIGNANHIKFQKDSVDVFLPFFGVRHSGGGYGTEGAIVYKGPIKNLRIEEMPDRGRVKMFFEGTHKTEVLSFDITVFPGGNTSTSVGSSQRDRMGYDGKIVEKY